VGLYLKKDIFLQHFGNDRPTEEATRLWATHPTIAEAPPSMTGGDRPRRRIVDTTALLRVHIPSLWVDYVVAADRPFFLEPLFTRVPHPAMRRAGGRRRAHRISASSVWRDGAGTTNSIGPTPSEN
jgi:hypothetical protein